MERARNEQTSIDRLLSPTFSFPICRVNRGEVEIMVRNWLLFVAVALVLFGTLATAVSVDGTTVRNNKGSNKKRQQQSTIKVRKSADKDVDQPKQDVPVSPKGFDILESSEWRAGRTESLDVSNIKEDIKRFQGKCSKESRNKMMSCYNMLAQADKMHKEGFFGKVSNFFTRAKKRIKKFIREESKKRGIPEMADTDKKVDELYVYVEENISRKITCFEYLGGKKALGEEDCIRFGARKDGQPVLQTCLFLRGAGTKEADFRDVRKALRKLGPTHVKNSYYLQYDDRYYGHAETLLEKELICDPVFFVTDTKERGWSDNNYQMEICNAIARTHPDVVYTHSAANLGLAAGYARQLPGCRRVGKNPFDIVWYSSQAPFRGAPVEFQLEVCNECKKTLYDERAIQDRLNRFHHSKASDFMLRKFFCNVARPIFRKMFCRKDKKTDKYNIAPAHVALSRHYINPLKGYDYMKEPFIPQVDCGAFNSRLMQDVSERPNKPTPLLENWEENMKKEKRLHLTLITKCRDLWDIANHAVSGSMCGYSPGPIEYSDAGLKTMVKQIKGTVEGLTLELTAMLINNKWTRFGDETKLDAKSGVTPKGFIHGNDGLVSAHSCMIHPSGTRFYTAPEGLFYATLANHAQGRCDMTVLKDSKKISTNKYNPSHPCKWYEMTAGHSLLLKFKLMESALKKFDHKKYKSFEEIPDALKDSEYADKLEFLFHVRSVISTKEEVNKFFRTSMAQSKKMYNEFGQIGKMQHFDIFQKALEFFQGLDLDHNWAVAKPEWEEYAIRMETLRDNFVKINKEKPGTLDDSPAKRYLRWEGVDIRKRYPFDDIDTNKDGRLTIPEFRRYYGTRLEAASKEEELDFDAFTVDARILASDRVDFQKKIDKLEDSVSNFVPLIKKKNWIAVAALIGSMESSEQVNDGEKQEESKTKVDPRDTQFLKDHPMARYLAPPMGNPNKKYAPPAPPYMLGHLGLLPPGVQSIEGVFDLPITYQRK